MPEKINLSGVIRTGISDHSLIYGIRKINPIISPRKKAKKIEVRNMKRFIINIILMTTFLLSRGNKLSYNQTDSMRTLWKELFLGVLDKHAPIQHIRKKSSSIPWLTSEIKKLLFDRDKKNGER